MKSNGVAITLKPNVNLENDIKKALRFFIRDKNICSQMSKKHFQFVTEKVLIELLRS